MSQLKNVLPVGDRVLYVFYDFETTHNTRYLETATVKIPNIVCLQQICSRCEDVEDDEHDCVQCGVRKHLYWDDPEASMLSYLCEPSPSLKRS